MAYTVLFDSKVADEVFHQVSRTLRSLDLDLIQVGDSEVELQSAGVPVITLGPRPADFPSLSSLGPRGWIAILPEEEGSPLDFTNAGAFAVLRLPVERSILISTLSRCLCGHGV